MRESILTILLVSAFAVPAAAQESADSVAARIGNEITAESVDSDRSVGYGQSYAVYDATPQQVLDIVLNYGEYAEFMPHFTQSRVLSARGTSAIVYLQASAFHDTITFWANMRIRKLQPRGTTEIVEGRMTEGNLDAFIAHWEITPVEGGKTLVQFKLLVDPDLPFPSAVATGENVRNARRVLSALRGRLSGN